MKAYRTPVRILETTEGHLELVFKDNSYSKVQTSAVTVNTKYGAISGDEYLGEDEELEPQHAQIEAEPLLASESA